MTTAVLPTSPSLPLSDMLDEISGWDRLTAPPTLSHVAQIDSTHTFCKQDEGFSALVRALHRCTRAAGLRAECQTGGIGTVGPDAVRRVWHSPPGNVSLSCMVRVPATVLGTHTGVTYPAFPQESLIQSKNSIIRSDSYPTPYVTGSRLAALPMTVGAVLVRALHQLGLQGVSLKYPNDIYVFGQKAGGILCELPSCCTPIYPKKQSVTSTTVTTLLEEANREHDLCAQMPWISFSPENEISRHTQFTHIPADHEVPLLISFGLNLELPTQLPFGYLRSQGHPVAGDPHRLGLHLMQCLMDFFAADRVTDRVRELQAWFVVRPELVQSMFAETQLVDATGCVSQERVCFVGLDLVEGIVQVTNGRGELLKCLPREMREVFCL